MTVQLTNVITTSTVAVLLDTSGESLILARNVIVSSDSNDGVQISNNNNAIINYGSIFSGTSDAIATTVAADHTSIVNEIDGIISAGGDGISLGGNHTTITNKGDISALGRGVSFGGIFNDLINFGDIFGRINGVDFTGSGVSIDNRGSIRSDSSGLFVFGTVQAKIINSGTIAGGVWAINCFVGSINLNNSGVIEGIINCTDSLADTVINTGKITGSVSLGGGADTFTGTGGISGAVNGGAGNDQLTGGSGNDTLVGSLGKDLLQGKGGKDTFDFDFAAESQGADADTILGFSHAQGDRIDFRTIDATPGGADNAFLFAGTQSFAAFNATHNGGVVRAVAGVVQVDIGGNGTVDMVIKTPGVMLHATDFFL